MTPKYEDHYEGKNRKTLDDIYHAIRAIESKVEDIIEEINEFDCRGRSKYNNLTMKDFYENGEDY